MCCNKLGCNETVNIPLGASMTLPENGDLFINRDIVGITVRRNPSGTAKTSSGANLITDAQLAQIHLVLNIGGENRMMMPLELLSVNFAAFSTVPGTQSLKGLNRAQTSLKFLGTVTSAEVELVFHYACDFACK